MMSIKEASILNMLLKKDRTTPVKSISILGLMTLLKDTSYKMSESTLRKYVNGLLKNGYLECGLKKEQEKRYYISEQGIKIMSEITGGEMNE